MAKAAKILILLVAILLAVAVGLTVFLRLYLTEERIQALVIPRAEKALGRKVAMGTAKVGLFSGITLKDVIVKEQDGVQDFVRIRRFVLRLSLLPLLKRQLVITKVELLNPYVQVLRDPSGRFNFETLSVLKEGPARVRKAPKAKAEAPALPVALMVKEIRVKGAKLAFKDALAELPKTDATLDLRLSLALGREGTSLSYKGDASFEARIHYDEIEGRVKGKAKFDQREVHWSMEVKGDGQELRITGGAKDYLQRPQVVLNILSDSVNLEKLLALKEKVPRKGRKGGRTTKGSRGPQRKAQVPLPDLKLSGQMKVGEVLYKGLKLKDVQSLYEYERGVFQLKDLLAKVAGGEVKGRATLDLNPPLPRHEAHLELAAVEVAPLWKAFLSKGEGVVRGTLQAELNSRGQGLQWEVLRRRIDAQGTYSLKEGRLLDFKPLGAMAVLLGLEELRDLSFRELKGNFEVVRGKVHLRSTLDGRQVRAKADGEVGLDGTLNLPVLLELSPQLGDRLKRKAKFARYLVAKEGWTAVPLTLKGSWNRPRVALDRRFIKKGIQKALEEFLGEKGTGRGEALPGGFLKGLLGR